ncbi:hypothetical protein LP419_05565 [Massilia sp. H-1]|nr:hypothetical protein LP419_05565 [Massilia sp. H-1]
MFRTEWRRQRGTAPLGTVVIVDQSSAGQYLAPEFDLFRLLFQRHGWQAVIADPAALAWRDGKLWHADTPVDLVYNRLTDFYLEEPAHAALRSAYEAGAVVLTPDPHAHALFADKRNLIALSDDALLAQWGPRPTTAPCCARRSRPRNWSRPRGPTTCGRGGAACSSSRW